MSEIRHELKLYEFEMIECLKKAGYKLPSDAKLYYDGTDDRFVVQWTREIGDPEKRELPS